jgi:hypothetical protein
VRRASRLDQETIMNQDLRELDLAELDAVSGGSIIKTISDGIAAGIRAGAQWLADNRPFPIQVDLSGATKAGQQLGQMLGGKPPA